MLAIVVCLVQQYVPKSAYIFHIYIYVYMYMYIYIYTYVYICIRMYI
jgi:hypothetical protein